MERHHRAAMISFFTSDAPREGEELALDEDAVAHARARRAAAGDDARLLDGRGTVAAARIAAIEKRNVLVLVTQVARMERPATLQVLAPVADRDRMLLAAEKCAELQVTEWIPVWFARSRSVSPRGEGERFRAKMAARMRSALEQSGGAWLPQVSEEMDLGAALAAVTASTRLLLDSRGTSIQSHISNNPIALLVGPEGGMEESEASLAVDNGWRPVALAATTLRFETAIITAAGTVRALQMGT